VKRTSASRPRLPTRITLFTLPIVVVLSLRAPAARVLPSWFPRPPRGLVDAVLVFVATAAGG
jgi:hypothetical protein